MYTVGRPLVCLDLVCFLLRSCCYQWGCTVSAVSAPEAGGTFQKSSTKYCEREAAPRCALRCHMYSIFAVCRSVGGGQVLRHRRALLAVGGTLRHRQQAARRPRPHPPRRHRCPDGDFFERVGDEISGSEFGRQIE